MPTEKTISSVMTSSPIVGHKGNKFSQILRVFTEFTIHHLPIVDDDNKLIGIISANDFPKLFLSLTNRAEPLKITQDVLNNEISVVEMMTANPVTISSSEPVVNAIQIFAQHKFASLPVVDNGVLVGILTSKDVMSYLNAEYSSV